MTTKAEVETLTAEVKTLVVGNRQITLSVARQLDGTHIDNMSHVFGRIELAKKRKGYYGEQIPDMWVIGKHKDTGALVVSNIGAHPIGTVDMDWYSELPKIILAGLK